MITQLEKCFKWHKQINAVATLLTECLHIFISDNSDITVTCGTNYMYLRVLLCPMYFAGYNETLMALNAKFNVPSCLGVADWTANPPVLNFNFSISQESLTLCGNSLNVRTWNLLFNFNRVCRISNSPCLCCWLGHKSVGFWSILGLLPDPVC